ncbi:hypothetical protein CEXT_398311 [Caerostris extrusa]|uniref:Uncharacterized protein n=1 Tax=Caerostris extrusa TaxID=172846 RepID=A0AAV4Y8C8_CAEEX|nr:hypothetical protein CEXT_398311 [Caerostris extrusa]
MTLRRLTIHPTPSQLSHAPLPSGRRHKLTNIVPHFRVSFPQLGDHSICLSFRSFRDRAISTFHHHLLLKGLSYSTLLILLYVFIYLISKKYSTRIRCGMLKFNKFFTRKL